MERIHASSAPPPTTAVSAVSGSVTYDSAVPAGLCDHRYGGVAVHSPFGPLDVLPLKFVGGLAVRLQVNVSVPSAAGAASLSAPPAARYQDRAVVPAGGKRSKERSNPAYGRPGAPPAPLSNRIRTGGSASNAARAAS